MKKILIVENDPSVLQLLDEVLNMYNVIKASSYEEALQNIREAIVDLAIVDYKLGDHDGFELIGLLREINPSLPIIMLTAYGNKDVVIRALREGVKDFIEKPLVLKYLIEKVDLILNKQQADCPNCAYYKSLVDELRKMIVDIALTT